MKKRLPCRSAPLPSTSRGRRQRSRQQPRSGGGGGRAVVAGALLACTAALFAAPPLPPGLGLLPVCSALAAVPLRTDAPLSISSDGGRTAERGVGVVNEEGVEGGSAGNLRGAGGEGTTPVPKVPFCRAGADVANVWMPVFDPDNQVMETAKRVVVFGGRGIDYYNKQAGDQLSYLSDMWALHITNTGFRWNKVTPPHGHVQPSPRWQTGDSVAYGSSLVVYGGDDQTTNQVGGLGDLWVYTPRGTRSSLHGDEDGGEGGWASYTRGGMHPGERREPSLTMINSTLLLQGGRVEDGDENERCDSRFFLVDLADPDGIWREGPSFPGECGLGQTMDTVNITRNGETQVRAVVFGGCKWDSEGIFTCSNDLYAYDLGGNVWEEIVPKSDADAYACVADDVPSGDEGAHSAVAPPRFSTSSSSSLTSTSTSPPASSTAAVNGGDINNDGTGSKKKKRAACPGTSTSRPLGRHAHASAYIESKTDSVNALFIFGGRENADDLTPLGDLWMFDFKKMRWTEITPDSDNSPGNRFYHSLTVWQGGAGDGVASLVVFGGETITRTGQTAYMNDVWLYTPHTGMWREVSQSDCKEGASGIVRGGNWTALMALVFLLVFVVVVQCLLHYICPTYQPPLRRRRRRRRKTDDAATSGSALAGANGGGLLAATDRRGKSDTSLVTQGLLASSSTNSEKPSYQAVAE